jgi:hypothetical protein
MGDGFAVEMSEKDVMRDIVEGSEDAADRGEIPVLSASIRNYCHVFLLSYPLLLLTQH